MKNKIKFFAMAACCMSVALFSGCEKEQQHKVFSVTIEGNTSDSKVHLVNRFPNFVQNEQININGVIYYALSSGNAVKFAAFSDGEADAPYYSVFPATTDMTNQAQPSFVLPENQSYVVENNAQQFLAPMCAVNTTEEIKFHNLCSVLEVKVLNPSDAAGAITIDEIQVSSQTIKLSYPDGLQINEAMDPANPENRQQLIALTNPTGADSAVTLIGCADAGTIAKGGNKSFLIYLPTYDPGTGNKVTLHVRVKIGRKIYTRTVRLDKLERNMIYTKDFALTPAIVTEEPLPPFFRISNASSDYDTIFFYNNNNGAADQLSLGTKYTTAGSWDVLDNSQWAKMFSETTNGLAKVGNQYGWVFLPAVADGFEMPSGCLPPTAGSADNGKYTVTLYQGGSVHTTVMSYTAEQWASMEAAGALFIPIDVVIPTEKDKEKSTYTFYYVPGIKKEQNMYFLATCKTQKKNINIMDLTIVAGTNVKQDVNGYYVRQTIDPEEE